MSNIHFVKLLELNKINECSVCVWLESFCWLGEDCKIICLKVNVIWTFNWPTFVTHLKVVLLSFRNKYHLHVFLGFELHNFVFYFLRWKYGRAVVADVFFLIIYRVGIWDLVDTQRKGLSKDACIIVQSLVPFNCKVWVVNVEYWHTLIVRDL